MHKILIDELSVRTPVREPQLAEQLVEVPTIISYSSMQRIVEQNVDIPVPRGGARGLQGFLPGQASTTSPLSLERISERNVEQIVDSPVFGGLPDFRPLLRTFQLVPWTSRFIGFSHFSQPEKKCGFGSAPGVGTECGLHFIHAVRL